MPRQPKALPQGWKGTGHRPATPAQISQIHVYKNRLNMDDEGYRALIARHGQGVMSSKDLSRAEASKVISELAKKADGSAPAKPVTTGGNVTALATPAQKALIGHLVREVAWHAHGSFADWLLANQGIGQVITKEQASRTIEGLKGLKRNGHALPA